MYIGIDFGTKRIGVAVTDPDGTMALPHSVIANDRHAIENIAAIARDRAATTIVVGRSMTLAGADNKLQSHIDQFVGELRTFGFTVVLEDERFSSAQATHIQGKTAHLDASAATLILQSFLDRQKHHAVQ